MAQGVHPQQSAPEQAPPVDAPATVTENTIRGSRYVFLLAIISTFVAAVVLLVLGFVETFEVVFELLRFDGHTDSNAVRLHFIEVLDMFLLATILYFIAAGFYQLFGPPVRNLPAWMRVDSVDDLEHKLIGVLITVLGVFGLAQVAGWDGQSNLLPFGITVALLILALGYFATRTSSGH